MHKTCTPKSAYDDKNDPSHKLVLSSISQSSYITFPCFSVAFSTGEFLAMLSEALYTVRVCRYERQSEEYLLLFWIRRRLWRLESIKCKGFHCWWQRHAHFQTLNLLPSCLAARAILAVHWTVCAETCSAVVRMKLWSSILPFKNRCGICLFCAFALIMPVVRICVLTSGLRWA